MKLIAVVFGVAMLSVSASLYVPYHQGSHLVPSLAPRLEAHKAPTKTLITRNDNYEKNFTHDELFTLQKKFLDNFVTPNNTYQVRSSASDLRSTSTNPHRRRSPSTPPFWLKMSKDVLILRAPLMAASSTLSISSDYSLT